jgi:hypothetical protein
MGSLQKEMEEVGLTLFLPLKLKIKLLEVILLKF